jgi:4Fe-4S ferredoxin
MSTMSPLQLYKLLPKLNCGKCGEPSCMAFVYRLQKGEKKTEACPPLMEPPFSKQLQELKRVLSPLEKASKTGILIDDNKCTGCGVCVEICPVNQAEQPETSFGREPSDRSKLVLAIKNGKVMIVDLAKCRRNSVTSSICRDCEIFCPSKAISFV